MFSQKVIKEPNSFQFLEMNQKCDRMKKKITVVLITLTLSLTLKVGSNLFLFHFNTDRVSVNSPLIFFVNYNVFPIIFYCQIKKSFKTKMSII